MYDDSMDTGAPAQSKSQPKQKQSVAPGRKVPLSRRGLPTSSDEDSGSGSEDDDWVPRSTRRTRSSTSRLSPFHSSSPSSLPITPHSSPAPRAHHSRSPSVSTASQSSEGGFVASPEPEQLQQWVEEGSRRDVAVFDHPVPPTSYVGDSKGLFGKMMLGTWDGGHAKHADQVSVTEQASSYSFGLSFGILADIQNQFQNMDLDALPPISELPELTYPQEFLVCCRPIIGHRDCALTAPLNPGPNGLLDFGIATTILSHAAPDRRRRLYSPRLFPYLDIRNESRNFSLGIHHLPSRLSTLCCPVGYV